MTNDEEYFYQIFFGDDRGPTAAPCQECGEIIPHPISRLPSHLPPLYLCSECIPHANDNIRSHPGAGRGDYGGGIADRQYHGGQFNEGEW